jgi:hypothetical protein
MDGWWGKSIGCLPFDHSEPEQACLPTQKDNSGHVRCRGGGAGQQWGSSAVLTGQVD